MERRQQITRIFQAALTRDSRERAAFLADACAGDDELLSSGRVAAGGRGDEDPAQVGAAR